MQPQDNTDFLKQITLCNPKRFLWGRGLETHILNIAISFWLHLQIRSFCFLIYRYKFKCITYYKGHFVFRK